jgi:hypothetical protein
MAKSTAPSYPFPARNPSFPAVGDIIYTPDVDPEERMYRSLFDRAKSQDARQLRLQYLCIEEELERAYQYVSPCEANGGSFSHKFAEVIRSASNAYETQCRSLYSRFYNDADAINIFNYLALDIFLGLAGCKVTHHLAVDSFGSHPEVVQPFVKLTSWDRVSPVGPHHTPAWWTGYTKIKHSLQGLAQHATLSNATAAVAGLHLLIERVFGFGVLSGGMWRAPGPPETGQLVDKRGVLNHTKRTPHENFPRWSRLFSKL